MNISYWMIVNTYVAAIGIMLTLGLVFGAFDFFAKRKFNEKYDSIYEKFKTKWESTNNGKPENDIFYNLYNATYELYQVKVRKNRLANFIYKYIFLIILSAIPLFLALSTKYLLNLIDSGISIEIGDVLLAATASTMIPSSAAFVVIRYVDVRKFQETWARQSYNQNKMFILMLDFLEKSDKNKKKKKKTFKADVLTYWKGTGIQKFVDNLENKENNISEGVTLPTTKNDD